MQVEGAAEKGAYGTASEEHPGSQGSERRRKPKRKSGRNVAEREEYRPHYDDHHRCNARHANRLIDRLAVSQAYGGNEDQQQGGIRCQAQERPMPENGRLQTPPEPGKRGGEEREAVAEEQGYHADAKVGRPSLPVTRKACKHDQTRRDEKGGEGQCATLTPCDY